MNRSASSTPPCGVSAELKFQSTPPAKSRPDEPGAKKNARHASVLFRPPIARHGVRLSASIRISITPGIWGAISPEAKSTPPGRGHPGFCLARGGGTPCLGKTRGEVGYLYLSIFSQNLFCFKLDAKSVPEALASTILILLQFSIDLAHRQNFGVSARSIRSGTPHPHPIGTPSTPLSPGSSLFHVGCLPEKSESATRSEAPPHT